MVVPDGAARHRLLEERSSRLRRAMRARIAEDRVAIGELAKAFGDPRLLIASAQQRIDENVARMERATSQRLARDRDGHARLGARLVAAHPRERIARDRHRAEELAARLASAGQALARDRRGAIPRERLEAALPRLVDDRRARVATLSGRLDAMSPVAVLARGYAIVTRQDGHAVRDAGEVAEGDAIQVRVAAGSFAAKVEKTKEERGGRKP
jgi:exodeoxyribonuclease VII large subunit